MITVGNKQLSIKKCIQVSKYMHTVKISDSAIARINAARKIVETLVEENRVVYGFTTGFGSLSNKCIQKDKTVQLQQNLIRSHAVGMGTPIAPELVRSMLLIRLVCICNGNSGVRLEVANKIVEALNKNLIPMVPEQGTVGASGDLAPLSHLILGLMGEGKSLDVDTNTYVDTAIVMKKLAIEPIVLLEKEGLALNNGTQFITSHAVFAIHDAMKTFNQSNMIASMSIEALHGTHKAFDPLVHAVKPHTGQIHVANEISGYILEKEEPSDINKTHAAKKVQDAYDLRCIPQIHGSVYDALMFAKKHIETEMNSSNDNPLIFPEHDRIISGGNFHGMYMGMATDLIAYAMSILCNISERRTDRLMNPALNGFLPEFLTENAGLNSGLMIVQYSSAALTSENRQLANPASVGNIPTCNGCESVVSMSGWSCRKARQSVENALTVLALELFSACQALDFTKEKTTTRLHHIHHHIRKHVHHIDSDTYMKPGIDIIVSMLKDDVFRDM
uniref:histidine ammonia-lyase n=1 Tax=viral metagenome TaxID=1070528 RepID=A0A6C0CC18_9ZZZZ